MSKISLTNRIINDFMKHSQDDYPHECCGFILGNFKDKESIGNEYVPASNIKEENRQNILDNHCYTNRVEQLLSL